MKKIWFLSLLVGLVMAGCNSGDDNGNGTDDDGTVDNFDRGQMLENWADDIIVPSYGGFLNDFSTLKTQFQTFETNRNQQNLSALRQAWVDAYKSWQHISLFEIGPAEENGLRLNINTYPTDVTLLQNHVTSGSYDLSLPSNRDAKGFPALDYLINGLGANDAEIVAVYNTQSTDVAYLSYFGDVLDDIETRVTAVRNDWNSGYRDTFVGNDGSSASASVDRFVNDFIFYYEKFLRAGKMGIPLGVFSGSQAPNTVEAFYYPQLSNELFQEGLDAVEDFFRGKKYGASTTRESLGSYLVALKKQDLRDDILGQLQSARNAVGNLQPFRTELETNNPASDMLNAYSEVQKTVALFKVDMVSSMSIAIDFVDADGD